MPGFASLSEKDRWTLVEVVRTFASSLVAGRYKGGSSPEEIWTRFYTGLDGSPMPSYAGKATHDELWALTKYLLNLRAEAGASMEETK